MHEFTIDSLDDPRIGAYRHLKRGQMRERDRDLVIAEGEKLVLRLLASSWQTESVLCTPALRERLGDRIPAPVAVYVADSQIISQLIGFQFHRGVLAAGVPPADRGLVATLESTDSASDPLNRSLVVLCPEIRDPDNLGSIIRSSSAFGAVCLVAGHEGTTPFSRRVMRTSMGAVMELSIVQTDNWNSAIETLHHFGYETVAAVLDPSADPLPAAPCSGRIAVLLGNEHSGVPAELSALCRRQVRIPMSMSEMSLNVAVAAGIILHHFAPSGFTREQSSPARRA